MAFLALSFFWMLTATIAMAAKPTKTKTRMTPAGSIFVDLR